MNNRNHTAHFTQELEARLQNGRVTDLADFSPGPWWGFNGVCTVALTADRLWVLTNGSHIKRGIEHNPAVGKLRSYMLQDIQDFRCDSASDRKVRMSFRNGHSRRKRVFTSKWTEGFNLAEHLSVLISEH
jgi:hypothetical protein